MSAGRPPEFGGVDGTWPMYRVRLEAHFEAHHIADEAKKQTLLISSLTDSAVVVVEGRYYPRKVNELSYDGVAGHLEEHYTPHVNDTAASYAFFMRTQKTGKSVQDFIAEIRQLAQKCYFRRSSERMLRD
ncbi:hypothetical protein HPB51_005063 [Rhipicephalus microplus]|uniref:Uncharacterized protein n=1 Tax=Rhipicephalus microplus TaxID=6941 RepID=A0A9J6EXE0_RHIMP|nr:hypothetical protein HPB51_005063 [Rhipicephalus microplus]